MVTATPTPRRRVIVHRPGIVPPVTRLGATGLKNLGGRIQEEYLTRLRSWDQAVQIYLEMKDDITISTELDAVKLPLLAADFAVTPASESIPDLFAKEFVWESINSMHHQTWRSHVDDALSAIDFGFNASEIVLEKRSDGRLWIRNLEPRGQETLMRWEFDDHDTTLGFTQRDPDTGRMVTIPITKLIHTTFRGRKGNPQGKPLLRDLYRNWRFIKELENLEGIGIERNVGGMPVAELPEQPLTEQGLTDLQESLRNLRVDDEMYLITPHGLTVSSYASSSPVGNIGPVIQRKQKEMLMRVFAQFLELGMEIGGTQALVKGSQDFFSLGLIAVQQFLLETWNQQLIPYLFFWNQGRFPGITGLPTLTWNDPGKVDLEGFVNSYSTAVQAKLVTPVSEDEEHYRAIADLPDLPPGEGEGPRDVELPAQPQFQL